MKDMATKNPVQPIILLLASLAYCHFLLTKLPNGLPRLILLMPVLYIHSILPWYSSSSFLRGVLCFFITWIASFKLLLLCFNRGPLTFANRSYTDFVAISIFPLNMKELNNPPSTPQSTKGFRKLFGITLLMFLTFFVHQEFFPPQLKLPLYGLSITFAFYVMHEKGFTRYELVPMFNRPYLATSLQDFWGRRWNRYSSSILRQTIYEPTRRTLTNIVGAGSAKMVAVMATLVVSGVMHELMFHYISCGTRPTYEVTAFFALQGICMVCEAAFKYLFRANGWNPIHPVISIILTVGFVVVTLWWLLVLPVWNNVRTGYCASSTHSHLT